MKITIIGRTFLVKPEEKIIVCRIKTKIGFFSGVAKCYHDDQFDETQGKRIAETKAKAKLFRCVKNALKKEVLNTHKKYEMLVLSLQKYNSALKKEIDHFNKLTNKL